MASILSLPEEIVDIVCRSLDKFDVVSLRLTCKELKDKSYHQFAVKHFETTTVMVTRNSLQLLIDIAQNKTYGAREVPYGSCIRHLRISAASFPAQSIVRVTGLPLDAEKDLVYRFWKDEAVKADMSQVKKRRRKAHATLTHEQRTLRKRGEAVKLLAKALNALTKVDTITVVSAAEPDHSDPLLPAPQPWGIRRLRQQIGMLPESEIPFPQGYSPIRYNNYEANTTWIVCTALAAIVSTGRKLKEFNVQTPFSLDFEIPKRPTSRSKTFIPAHTLSESHLEALGDSFSTLKALALVATDFYEVSKSVDWVQHFTTISPKLEEFSFRAGNNPMNIYQVIGQKTVFPRLRVLKLQNGAITYNELAQILTTYSSTLELLEFVYMKLETDIWVNVLRMLRSLPRLTSLRLLNITQPGLWGATLYIWNHTASVKQDAWRAPGPGQSHMLVFEEPNNLDMVQRLETQIEWQGEALRR